MAKYYSSDLNDRKPIYDVADIWKKDCLVQDKSIIWEGEFIWTPENVGKLYSIFVNAPDASGNSFDEKLQKQLSGESESTYKLAIEMLFIYYLFPKKINYRTKVEKLQKIAGWKDIDLHSKHWVFDAFKYGIGATGPFYNTSKYFELSFLVLFTASLKEKHLDERSSLLADHSETKIMVEKSRREVGKKVQMQHILLHLLFPEYFERIASWGHKTKIVKAFSDLLVDTNIDDEDEKLLLIRKKLEENYPEQKFDFYDLPKIKQVWLETIDTEDNNVELTDVPEIETLEESININFNPEPTIEGLIFENEEILINQVITAIRNGKHIILTGPPGTGKSKLAKKICKMYEVSSRMVTAASNWSTYETIGGYRPDQNGDLFFDEGFFLDCVKNRYTSQIQNKWLIIDEINRADIDKAFGPLFSVLTGDQVILPYKTSEGEIISLNPEGSHREPEASNTYVFPNDWRIIATMNTIDKASLYEMSYAFMRRFAFIPVNIPKEIDANLVENYLNVWGLEKYPNTEALTEIWRVINQYRKIGPAIVEDIARHTQDNEDFGSAIILYVLPQFEGLPIDRLHEFINKIDEIDEIMNREQIEEFIMDFFDAGAYE